MQVSHDATTMIIENCNKMSALINAVFCSEIIHYSFKWPLFFSF